MSEGSIVPRPGGKKSGGERRRVGWKPAADPLAMPEVDDPAGDGHMWSGVDTPANDLPLEDSAFDAPMHVPTKGAEIVEPS